MEYKTRLLRTLRDTYDTISAKRDAYINDYKFRYDSRRKVTNFKIGDQVMLYWPVPKKGYSLKLLPRWDGPYKIDKQLGPVTYRIAKDDKTLCAHVQRLKHYQPW